MRWRHERERDLERELQAHLELEAEEQQAAGLGAAEARHAARRAFGNPALVKEDTRAAWGWTAVQLLANDVRYALRAMRRERGFTAAAILSLALGIGANTAIFSLMDALLLRSLPVHNPGELVELMLVERGHAGDSFGYPSVRVLADRSDLFAGVCGFSGAVLNIHKLEETTRLNGAWVSGGCYGTLGIEPLAGRLLTPDDDRPGAAAVAVLSYAYWKDRFGGDFRAVGQDLRIEGQPVRIVGISPRGFDGATIGFAANVTLALAAMPQLFPERAGALESGPQWLRVLARPRPGLTVEQLKARLAVVWPQMAAVTVTPQMDPRRREVLLASSIAVIPGGTGWSLLRGQFRRPLTVLLAITGLVLLVACANFANLLLARGAARGKEIALRFAIGAGRSRVVRQLLTESVALSVAGALVGLGLAGAGGRALLALLSAGQFDGIVLDLSPDLRVLLFTTSVALVTGLVFGLAPAWRATAMGPAAALKGGSGIAPRTRSRLLPALVVTQAGLSLALLIGAGLFIRTLEKLRERDPGFRSEGVLLVTFDARRAGYQGERLAALYHELLDRFGHLGGVASVSLSTNTPLSGGYWSSGVSVDGRPPGKEAAQLNSVALRYFETLGTPLVRGRDFEDRDQPGAAGTAVVNEAFASKYLSGGDPLGRHISFDGPRHPVFEIVGVVRNTVAHSLREAPPPFVYLPYFQDPGRISSVTFEVRVSGSPARVEGLFRDSLRARFAGAPVQVQIQGMTGQVDRSLVEERMLAALGACFGGLALVLAAVGLYGLLAYAVARSTSEIGIRLALGAQRGEVLGRVLRSALALLAGGIVVGLPAAWAGTRLIGSMLFGLGAGDPLTILLATAVLAATAMGAALVPALRAARVDPLVALRYE